MNEFYSLEDPDISLHSPTISQICCSLEESSNNYSLICHMKGGDTTANICEPTHSFSSISNWTGMMTHTTLQVHHFAMNHTTSVIRGTIQAEQLHQVQSNFLCVHHFLMKPHRDMPYHLSPCPNSTVILLKHG